MYHNSIRSEQRSTMHLLQMKISLIILGVALFLNGCVSNPMELTKKIVQDALSQDNTTQISAKDPMDLKFMNAEVNSNCSSEVCNDTGLENIDRSMKATEQERQGTKVQECTTETTVSPFNIDDKLDTEHETTDAEGLTLIEKMQEEVEVKRRKEQEERIIEEEVLKEKVAEVEAEPIILTARV